MAPSSRFRYTFLCLVTVFLIVFVQYGLFISGSFQAHEGGGEGREE